MLCSCVGNQITFVVTLDPENFLGPLIFSTVDNFDSGRPVFDVFSTFC